MATKGSFSHRGATEDGAVENLLPELRHRFGDRPMATDDYRDVYPAYVELRQSFCPGCRTLLEVTDVMPGYPLVQEFESDIETSCNEWVEEPIPIPDSSPARTAD